MLARLRLPVCLLLLAVAVVIAAPLTVYVAPNGSDAASGLTVTTPFATPERARDELRAQRAAGKLPPEGAVIELAAGAYPLAHGLELTKDDSGTAAGPIVIRAARGVEARLVGGQRVPRFGPVTDPQVLNRLDKSAWGKVVQADLKALGITTFGEIPGLYRGDKPLLELFFDGRPMQLARWPNDAWWTIWKVKQSGARPSAADPKGAPGAFYYHGDRPERWLKNPDILLRGYWRHDWYEEGQKIAQIDPQAKIITFTSPCAYGVGGGLRRYYALNILEELDAPGEWYLDRATGQLYFWPPAPLSQAEAWVSTVPGPLVSLKECAFVRLEGLIIEDGQSDGVVITSGSDNEIARCVIRNLGGAGVSVQGGFRNAVRGCDLYEIGRGAVYLNGGDRKTLTPGEHVVDNCHIHHFGRLQRTYAGAVHLDGVGNRCTHNLLHHAPHSAVLFFGNEHLIEFNEMHHLMLETHDAGACYMGRDFTCQGNMLRYNFIHHRGAFGIGSSGIYLDDGNAGNTIFGNIFHKGTWATVLGGSRDTKVLNNIFVECEPAVNIDDRAYNHLGEQGTLTMRLAGLPYREPPWSTRYPKLARIMEDERGEPLYNVVAHNVRYKGTWTCLNRRKEGKPPLEEITTFEDNWLEGDPKFVDAKHLNFQLREDSPVYRKLTGFERIPVEQIGCYQDPLRPIANFARDREEPMQPDRIVNPPEAPWLKPPPFPAYRLAAPVVLDGVESPGEWPAAGDGKPVMIAQTPDRTAIPYTAPRSFARAAYDDTALYVLVTNQTRDEKTLTRGDKWGSDDGVEVCFRAGTDGPIVVVHGFVNGRVEAVRDGGATAAQVRQLQQAGLALKTSIGPGAWVAEFRLPLAALGIVPKVGEKLQFNLGVRRMAESDWLAWAGTEAQNWRVDKAGELVFK
jgi:hypothetical protein